MNILIAPNTMKGSLPAEDFAEAIAEGFRQASPIFHPRCLPVADGGDYTAEILLKHLGARRQKVRVADPLGRPVEASYGIARDTAVLEMAEASGLRLLAADERNPVLCTTFGTGQLVIDALGKGCRKIIMGVGGSATVDGGIGMAKALGFVIRDRAGNVLPAVSGSLKRAVSLEPPASWPKNLEWTILTDVNNPLLGVAGAATVFGPQKGAGEALVAELEAGLDNWITILERMSGKLLRDLPGMGAAGGVAAVPVALLGAKLESGASWLLDLLQFDRHAQWADWIVTGEGSLDSQSLGRKAPGEVLGRARKAGKPVSVVCGSYEASAAGEFDGAISITDRPMTLDDAMSHAAKLVTLAVTQMARVILASRPHARQWHETLSEASLLISRNQCDEASLLLENPEMSPLAATWYLKGMISLKKQEWGGVINHFSQCIEIDPAHQKAKAGMEMARNILSFRAPDITNP